MPAALALLVLAQLPQHRVQTIYPLGGRAGETIEVQLGATDPEGSNALWFDHPGLRAFHIKANTYKVAIAPGTPVGQHDVRLVGPLGISNARTFVVGDRPESREAEPNNTPEKANPLPLNSVVNGRMDNTPDVDCFAFEGKAGRRLFLELTAAPLDSRLDGVLRVLDPSGRVIAESQDDRGPDPFVDVALPGDGRYVVKVHDVTFTGSPEHAYRLTLHDGPHLDAVLPPVIASSGPSKVTLLGRNLGPGSEPAPDQQIDGRPLEKKVITVTPPPSDDPTLGVAMSPSVGREGFSYRLDGPGGASNSLFLATSPWPVIAEAEPNSDASHAQMLTTPCAVAGTFGAPGDVDIYRFRARKGEVLWIEAEAERIASPADPTLVLQRVPDKGDPQDNATGDDMPDPFANQRFAVGSTDASVRFQAPEDGLYQIVLNDVASSQRGDARFSYRLTIRPERPDFRLVLVPENPNQVEGLTIRAGGRVAAYLLAWRLDGFNGPIRVEGRDLPPGVSCDPVLIGPGQALAPVVFTASAEAPANEGVVRLVGRGLSPDRKEVLAYAPGATKVLAEPEHEAIAGGLVWPPVNTNNANVGPARVTRGFVLAVRPGAPFLLTAKPADWIVPQGGTVELAVEVERRNGFTEAVTVNAADLPPNVGGASATIAKGANAATLKLTIPGNAPPGNYSFLLRGTGPFPFNKDPNAKDKPNVNVNEPSNVVRLTVRKP